MRQIAVLEMVEFLVEMIREYHAVAQSTRLKPEVEREGSSMSFDLYWSL